MMIYIWIVLILFGLVFRKSKLINALQIIFITFMMAFNDKNPDYINNYDTFLEMRNNFWGIWSGNWLYKLLFYVYGVFENYHILVFLLACTSMFLIYKSIEFYTDSFAFCFSLYLIASFVIDATQLKNLLAMSIWLYFSRYLYLAYIDEKNKRNVLLYILGVVLATSSHASFSITIIYLIALLVDVKIIMIIVSVVGVISTLSILHFERITRMFSKWLSSQQYNYLKFVSKKIYDYSLEFNLNVVSARVKLAVIFFVIFLIICWVMFRTKICKKDFSKQTILNFVLTLNSIIMFSIPLLILSTEFYRFQRNLLIMDYIMFSSMIVREDSVGLKHYVDDFFVLISSLIPAIYYLSIDAIFWNFEGVFKHLFWLS